jgi:serine/threonine protein kinase
VARNFQLISRHHHKWPNDRLVYLVGEWVEGDVPNPAEVSIDPQLLLGLSRVMAQGLVDLHRRKVAHRDIKPSNFIMQRQEFALGEEVPPSFFVYCVASGRKAGVDGKWIDLGQAKLPEDMDPADPATGLESLIGTESFSAPERFVDPGKMDLPCDIFSLGVSLFYLATGTYPRVDPREKDGTKYQFHHLEGTPIDRDLKASIVEMLSVDPGSRPTAQRVLDKLILIP